MVSKPKGISNLQSYLFSDIAIGAPWENDGRGAVYVYKGCAKGLNTENVQRIQPEGTGGFGWSIAKGVDVDKNNCTGKSKSLFEHFMQFRSKSYTYNLKKPLSLIKETIVSVLDKLISRSPFSVAF